MDKKIKNIEEHKCIVCLRMFPRYTQTKHSTNQFKAIRPARCHTCSHKCSRVYIRTGALIRSLDARKKMKGGQNGRKKI